MGWELKVQFTNISIVLTEIALPIFQLCMKLSKSHLNLMRGVVHFTDHSGESLQVVCLLVRVNNT